MGEDHAAAYLRVSTVGQGERHSLDRQRREVTNYAEENGYDLPDDRVFEDTVSGTRTDRRDYVKLLCLVEDNEVDVVVTYVVDRFGRNDLDSARLVHAAQETDTRLEAVLDGGRDYLDTPFSKFYLKIQSAMAELERDRIVERTLGGKEDAARMGYWATGFAPLGYTITGPRGRKVLEPNRNAVWVQRAFMAYLDGAGYRAISRLFREHEVEAVQGRGSSWSPQSIGELIQNPTYKGVISYDGIVVDGRHPPIVSEGVWEQAQKIRRSR